MPYSDHIKPVKTAVDASQLEGYEAWIDHLTSSPGAKEQGLTKATLKQMQSEFFRGLWAKGTWGNTGCYVPMWFTYLVFGHPTDNQLKQLTEDSLWFVDFVEEKLKAGQIVPVLEMASFFKKRLEQVNESS